jgi:hypothetical protein
MGKIKKFFLIITRNFLKLRVKYFLIKKKNEHVNNARDAQRILVNLRVFQKKTFHFSRVEAF